MSLLHTESIPDTEADAIENEIVRLLPPPPSRTGAAGDDPIVGRAPTWEERVDWGVIAVAGALALIWMLNALLEAVLS